MADRANIVAKDNVFTLEVASVKADDKGNYTCRITNANGEAVACSANLDVHQLSAAEKKTRETSQKPVFMGKLMNTALITDSSASMMVHVKGNPNPEVKFMKLSSRKSKLGMQDLTLV